MKNSPPSPPPKTRTFPVSVPAIAAFFLLGYILGLLSTFSSKNNTITHTADSVQSVRLVSSPPPLTQVTQQVLQPSHDLFRFRTNCSLPVPQTQVKQTILSKIYNNASPYTNFPSTDTTTFLLPVANRLRGWGSRNRVFADLISAVRPHVIIELGTFLGASALHMASITRNLSLPTLILCVDDFRGWPGFRARFTRDVPASRHADSLLLHQFMLGVVSAGETERVLPVPFSTGSALAALCDWGVYGDLVEVDAGHDFHSAWQDINMAYAVVRPGGVLFGHDYFTTADDRGVRRAVNLFAKVKGLRVTANGEHWVLSPKPELTVHNF